MSTETATSCLERVEAQPFLKWVGGKRALATRHTPSDPRNVLQLL